MTSFHDQELFEIFDLFDFLDLLDLFGRTLVEIGIVDIDGDAFFREIPDAHPRIPAEGADPRLGSVVVAGH